MLVGQHRAVGVHHRTRLVRQVAPGWRSHGCVNQVKPMDVAVRIDDFPAPVDAGQAFFSGARIAIPCVEGVSDGRVPSCDIGTTVTSAEKVLM